jgi:parvulin-like peptidyl-prolyl isomerase
MDKPMKKLLPFLLFSIITTQAQVIDAVAIDVEGEAITTLEIQAVQQKMNMSKQAAVEALIRDRLEKSALKKANIQVSHEEIQAKVQAIASSKGMSQAEMKDVLAKKGLTWESYITQLTTEIEKEHFFREHIIGSITPPTEDELKSYYNTHQEEFSSAPVQMSLVVYAAPTIEKIKEAIANPMRPVQGVQKKNILASSNEMTPQLLELINNTPTNSFTSPVKTAQGVIAYFVKSKGQQQSGFQAVKNTVANRWMQEQRAQAGQDFFNKLKSNANIRVIRL